MMRTKLSDVHCSIARTMEVLHDAWTALILRDVFAGITRFDQLQKDLDLSRKTLAERLERLVAEGVLDRRAYSERPPRYDYVPTTKGVELFKVITAVMAWGDRWTAGPEGPPARIRHRLCGHLVQARVVCDHCGETLQWHDCSPEAGPGGRTGHGTRLLGTVLAGAKRRSK